MKTKINLGIRPVWSESSLSAWRKLGSLAAHWAHSQDSDQTGRWFPSCYYCVWLCGLYYGALHVLKSFRAICPRVSSFLLAFWSPRLAKRELVCVLPVHLFVCFVRASFVSFFSFSWCRGLAAVCDCDTSWTFLLTFRQFCFSILFLEWVQKLSKMGLSPRQWHHRPVFRLLSLVRGGALNDTW